MYELKEVYNLDEALMLYDIIAIEAIHRYYNSQKKFRFITT